MSFPDQSRIRDESGFAMLVVLILITVASLLAVTLLSQGEHLDRSTFRDRKWHTALQVAESGVDRTIARLNADYNFAGFSTGPQSAPGGQFETTVANGASIGLEIGRKSITSTAYVPSKGHPKEVRRRIRVVLGPPPALAYAMFGEKCMVIDNGAVVTGDAFSNGHIEILNRAVLIGDVTSSNGALEMDPGSEVRKNGAFGGTARSGGRATATFGSACPAIGARPWGIQLENGSIVHRDARAQRPACDTSPAPPSSEYGMTSRMGAKILGDAVAWGSIEASISVSGARRQPVCEKAADPVPLPRYAAYDPATGYNVDFYTKVVPEVAVAEYSTVADFLTYMNNAANKRNLKGIHLIDPKASDKSTEIDMSGTTIKGHFVLATPSRIKRGNSLSIDFFDDTAAPKKTVQLISLADPGTVGIEFDDSFFGVKGEPCLLLYSTGTVVFKNKATIHGALYGDKVEVKNNLDLKYDRCIERSLAFGPDLAQVRTFFNELSPNS